MSGSDYRPVTAKTGAKLVGYAGRPGRLAKILCENFGLRPIAQAESRTPLFRRKDFLAAYRLWCNRPTGFARKAERVRQFAHAHGLMTAEEAAKMVGFSGDWHSHASHLRRYYGLRDVTCEGQRLFAPAEYRVAHWRYLQNGGRSHRGRPLSLDEQLLDEVVQTGGSLKLRFQRWPAVLAERFRVEPHAIIDAALRLRQSEVVQWRRRGGDFYLELWRE